MVVGRRLRHEFRASKIPVSVDVSDESKDKCQDKHLSMRVGKSSDILNISCVLLLVRKVCSHLSENTIFLNNSIKNSHVGETV